MSKKHRVSKSVPNFPIFTADLSNSRCSATQTILPKIPPPPLLLGIPNNHGGLGYLFQGIPFLNPSSTCLRFHIRPYFLRIFPYIALILYRP
jgi:hypothetical protein